MSHGTLTDEVVLGESREYLSQWTSPIICDSQYNKVSETKYSEHQSEIAQYF